MYRGLSVTPTPTDRAQGATFALLFLTQAAIVPSLTVLFQVMELRCILRHDARLLIRNRCSQQTPRKDDRQRQLLLLGPGRAALELATRGNACLCQSFTGASPA